jgi:hypothetical protein
VKLTRRSAAALGIAVILLGLAALAAAPRAEKLPDHLTLLETLAGEATHDLLDSLNFAAGTTVHLVPETPNAANWLVSRILEQSLAARGCRVVAPLFGREGGPESPANGGAAPQGAAPGAHAPHHLPSGATQTEPADTTQTPPANGSGAPSTPAPAEPAAPAVADAFHFALPDTGEVLTFRVVECGVTYPWVKRSLLVGPQRYGRIAAVRVWGAHLTEPGPVVQATARGERVHIDSFPGWARPLVEGQGYPFPLQVPTGSSLKSVVEPVVVAGVVAGLVYLFYQNQK